MADRSAVYPAQRQQLKIKSMLLLEKSKKKNQMTCKFGVLKAATMGFG